MKTIREKHCNKRILSWKTSGIWLLFNNGCYLWLISLQFWKIAGKTLQNLYWIYLSIICQEINWKIIPRDIFKIFRYASQKFILWNFLILDIIAKFIYLKVSCFIAIQNLNGISWIKNRLKNITFLFIFVNKFKKNRYIFTHVFKDK